MARREPVDAVDDESGEATALAAEEEALAAEEVALEAEEAAIEVEEAAMIEVKESELAEDQTGEQAGGGLPPGPLERAEGAVPAGGGEDAMPMDATRGAQPQRVSK